MLRAIYLSPLLIFLLLIPCFGDHLGLLAALRSALPVEDSVFVSPPGRAGFQLCGVGVLFRAPQLLMPSGVHPVEPSESLL